jgi:predicted Zn-dependent protease
MVSPQQEMALGFESAKQVLQTQKVSTDPVRNAQVKRIGQRIAKTTEALHHVNYQWEFFVIDNDKEANAFCLPGGKVFVYTGLFKYAANDDELAAVMGHEIAHALARHGAERMSSGQMQQVGGQILGAVMQTQGNPANTAMAMQAFGMGTKYGLMLPHSRTQEYEADHIGLVLAAKSGYNPRAALSFWEKFGASGETPPEYLSTHPAPSNRIAEIKALLPKTIPMYEAVRR